MLHSLSARSFYMENDHETDKPCLGYIRGDKAALMIDAGNSPAHHQQFLDELTAQGLPAPSAIAVTHYHWDHTYGMCAAQVPTLVNHVTQQHLQRMSAWAWDLSAMEHRLATGEDIRFCHDCILKEYPDLSAIRVLTGDVVYHGQLDLDLGGVHAQLLHFQNSHTDDGSVIYIPEEKLIFLGDINCDDLNHQPRCVHQARLDALKYALADLDFTIAIDGHYEHPLTKKDVLQSLDDMLREAALLLP